MNFGEAIALLKQGKYVTRPGWNGKGMYLYLKTITRDYAPCIVMRTAQGYHQPGWLASQADMLAEDWIEAPHVFPTGEKFDPYC